MDAVAERAGFSTATLYRCFGDRDGLVREVVRGSPSAAPVQAALLEDGPFAEVLVRFVEAMMARLRDQPHLLRLLLFADAEEIRELRSLRRGEERMSLALLGLFERRGERERLRPVKPERLAAALMGQVVGALLFQRLHGEAPDAKAIVALFLRGAQRPVREEEEKGASDERQA